MSLGRKNRHGSVRSGSAVAVLLIAALFLTGCQPSTLVQSLDAVITAAEIALPVIGSAAGLSPQTQTAIAGYLRAVDGATVQAATILSGTGTAVQKSSQIVALFAGLAQGCNCIPPGTPATVVNVIDAVAQAVARFVGNFGVRATAETPASVKLKGADVAALANIRIRAERNLANLKGVK